MVAGNLKRLKELVNTRQDVCVSKSCLVDAVFVEVFCCVCCGDVDLVPEQSRTSRPMSCLSVLSLTHTFGDVVRSAKSDQPFSGSSPLQRSH